MTSAGDYVMLDGCTVSYNEASTGGGLYLVHQGTITVNQTVISQNEAEEGGGEKFRVEQ